MLSIFYGDLKEAVYNTAAYFKYDYEDDWIVDPFVKKMIEDTILLLSHWDRDADPFSVPMA